MLYRNNAPVSSETWAEMEEQVKSVFTNFSSARKVFHLDGPKGFNFNVISEGRLNKAENKDGIGFSTYKVQPLTEIRAEFKMSRWELDNVLRGAKDVDYGPLEEATKKIALFEENAIYNGLAEGNIEGLLPASSNKSIKFGKTPNDIMEAISSGMIKLRENFAEGPYSLIVGEAAYKKILSKETSFPLDRRIEDLIGGEIVYNHVIDGAILVPFDHDDLEMTIDRTYL